MADSFVRAADIEELLRKGRVIQIKPEGYSMYPLFVPGRDEAVIGPVSGKKPKRGDVVLYRRKNSILVLHRIWKRDGEKFYMVGDNQKEIEGPLEGECIRGILKGIVRKGTYFPVSDPLYRILSGIWLFFRPFRPMLSAGAAKIKRLAHKNGGTEKSGRRNVDT